MESSCGRLHTPPIASTGSTDTVSTVDSKVVMYEDNKESLHEQDIAPSPVTWDGPNDPQNPQNWSLRRKWIITLVTSGVTINA